MIKLMKNILKVVLVIIILFGTTVIRQPVMATTTPINSAYLYAKSSYGNMLRYNGVEILTTFVVYMKDGVEYPAYCLDANMPGVGENGSYTVNTSNFLNDVMLWRVITNGYPYKTVTELGCNTKEEAFTATKQAVYCMLYGREASWYTPIGEQGKRVINAMTKILQNAKNSTSIKPSSDITLQSQESKWNVDLNDKNYVSQTFKIISSLSSSSCKLSLTGDFPDGTKIVDSKNNSITTISSGGTFKLMIPIKSLKSSGEFQIQIQSTLATKPVLYGKAPNSNWQDYAVTASIYEDASGSATVSYKKNETKIMIQKQDLVNRKPIPGVTFQVLDSDKKVVYTDLVSDSNGCIEINNIVPGRYYLEEIKTKERIC